MKARLVVMFKRPRQHLSTYVLVISLLLLVAVPALAQNGNTKSNSAQAALSIKVNVVQTVALPPVRQAAPESNAVTWNFSTVKPDVEVREEVRPLPRSAVGQSSNSEGAILKTLTIVPH